MSYQPTTDQHLSVPQRGETRGLGKPIREDGVIKGQSCLDIRRGQPLRVIRTKDGEQIVRRMGDIRA